MNENNLITLEIISKSNIFEKIVINTDMNPEYIIDYIKIINSFINSFDKIFIKVS